ncbi:MAG: DNA-binding response regulator [Sphingobacteriia bacterium]|nr:MAG: DNA-binding response regulator [Sphingobacteriia bacterium]
MRLLIERIMSQIKIFIADQYPIYRQGYISLINAYPNCIVVGEANNGQELLSAIKCSKVLPDIIMMDITMPIMNGYETVIQLKKQYPNIKILILSHIKEPNAMLHLFNSGINGYIKKCDPTVNFESVFQEIMDTGFLKNQLYKSPTTTLLNWDKYPFQGTIQLNHKEMEFIRLKLADFTLDEIAIKFCCAPKTVENYRNNLYLKIGINNKIDLIKYAYKMGWLYS